MKKFILPLNIVLALSLLVAACAPTATPEVVGKVVKETVIVEKSVEKVIEKVVKPTATPEVVEKVVKAATEPLVQEICTSGAFVGDPDEIGGFVEAFGQLVSDHLECSAQFDTVPESDKVRLGMEAGDLDIALLNARDYLLLDDALNLVPLFIPVYDVKGAFYRGAFIVRADSDIETLNDLEGRTFAYTAQESLYGYLLPRAFLSEQGYDPNVLFRETLFAGRSAGNVIRAVYNREADAGVIWADETGDARQLIADEIPDVWDTVKIIAYTPEIPYDIIAMQPNVSDGLREQLQMAMRQVSMGDEGKEALYGIYGIVELADPDDQFWKAVDWLRYAQELEKGREPWPEVVLTLTVLKGIVEVNGEPVTEGELSEGDVIATGAEGFAQLIFFDDEGISTELKPNTRMQVETLAPGEIRLFLFEGSMRNTLEPGREVRFVVAAEAGESEAGGTVWISEVDTTGALLVAVLEGRVVARAPGGYEVEVYEGERLDIPVDGVPGWPESTIFIYFHSSLHDRATFTHQSKPPTLTGRYSRMARALIAAGYVIEETVNPEPFGSYDVLIIFERPYGLTEENTRAIQNWVESGKGLFVSTHWTACSFNQPINSLLEPFGIRFIGGLESRVAYTEPGHPITAGVTNLPLYASCYLDGGIPLAYAETGELVLAAYEKGGRVLVLPDSESLTNMAWEDYDQTTFILNAMNWLAGK